MDANQNLVKKTPPEVAFPSLKVAGPLALTDEGDPARPKNRAKMNGKARRFSGSPVGAAPCLLLLGEGGPAGPDVEGTPIDENRTRMKGSA